MKIYIAGPMRGYPEDNYPLFNEVTAKWRRFGFEVVNPAENFGGDRSLPWSTYMKQDISQLVTCDAIALLPGYRSSEGARRELLIAQTLDLPVFDAIEMRIVATVKIRPMFADELEAIWLQRVYESERE